MHKGQTTAVLVEIPNELMDLAKNITGLGVESTVKLGLALVATYPQVHEKPRSKTSDETTSHLRAVKA